ncbi:MAG: FprA family A-type flavoprotein [Eubacteriales bacterium]|nr:FprA family A-type flavoprotein [Eubacteriales bacterium]
MNCIRKLTDDLLWVGGNDRRLHLFENAYPLPDGISYNAYLLLDEKTALLDTVDRAVGDEFFENLNAGLQGRELDYVIINHMEPDHCGTLARLLLRYPDVTVVSNDKVFTMIHQFFGDEASIGNAVSVAEGSTLSLGRHQLTFVMAPMVHWPEVMVTYDQTTGALFSADAFGTFGALDGCLFADEVDFNGHWLDEMRRYYTNIVGKYGGPVQTLLKKAAGLKLQMICPLHGPIWREHMDWLVEKHQLWSAYTPEDEGVLVAYASIYGHTKNAAEVLARELTLAGAKKVRLYDVSETHPSYLVAEAFRSSRWVFLSATYNAGIFPAMETLLNDLKAHGLRNRKVALVENGSWAPAAGKLMKAVLESMKDIQMVEPMVSVRSALREEQLAQLTTLARELLS